MQTLSLDQAIVLGALHGPAELLPISSSGHLTAIRWLFGWGEARSEARGRRERRRQLKSFDLALHAGATLAWLLTPGGSEALGDLASSARRRPEFLGLAVGLPAVAGLVFEDPIEQRMGTPATTAMGLAGGSVLMLGAERRRATRMLDDADAQDGLWLGLAQAAALLPGVSRSGAARATARIRGFDRRDSGRLAAQVGMPVIVGATMLKALRVLRAPQPAPDSGALAAGAGASFVSAWLLAPIARRWSDGTVVPFALYRSALAGALATTIRG